MCETWEKAKQPGTDAEGYGRFLWEIGGQFQIGSSNLPDFNFCPWCGAELPDEEHQ